MIATVLLATIVAASPPSRPPPDTAPRVAQAGVPMLPDLDGFIGKAFLRDCMPSPELGEFGESLNRRYGRDADGKINDPRASLRIPERLKAAVGPARDKHEAEYVDVEVPLAGTFRKLKVSGLTFTFGKENGFNILAVRFAEPRSALDKAFGREVRQANARFKAVEARDGVAPHIEINRADGMTVLVCDRST